MRIHIFRCTRNHEVHGLTNDETGNNLPKNKCEGGDWEYFKTIDMAKEDTGIIGMNPADEVISAIKLNGYYINNSESSTTERD